MIIFISFFISLETCEWRMFVWGADGFNVVDLQPIIPTIDLDTFVVNGEWELTATRARRQIHLQNGGEFPYVFYEVTLRRRPSLLVLTVLLPVLVLSLVNVFVFTVPSESGGSSVQEDQEVLQLKSGQYSRQSTDGERHEAAPFLYCGGVCMYIYIYISRLKVMPEVVVVKMCKKL